MFFLKFFLRCFRPGPGRPPATSLLKVVGTKAGGLAVRAKVAPITTLPGFAGSFVPLIGPVIWMAAELSLRARMKDRPEADSPGEKKEDGEA